MEQEEQEEPERERSGRPQESPKCSACSPCCTSICVHHPFCILSRVALTARARGVKYKQMFLWAGDDQNTHLNRSHQFNRFRPLSSLCLDIVVVGPSFCIMGFLPQDWRTSRSIHWIHGCCGSGGSEARSLQRQKSRADEATRFALFALSYHLAYLLNAPACYYCSIAYSN